MKRSMTVGLGLFLFLIFVAACGVPPESEQEEAKTRVAVAFQQTRIAVEEMAAAQFLEGVEVPEQPIPTPMPTAVIETPSAQQPTVISFEDWLKDVNILLYDDMFSRGETKVIQTAIDELGLGGNTTDVKDAVGHLLSQMNSAMQWDLVIIGAESRDNISGEYFDVIKERMERGTALILEVWHINSISQGRIKPVMEECGIAFDRDLRRNDRSDLNNYLVYLLDPTHPIFGDPTIIGTLIPNDPKWTGDVGDTVKLVPGSEARLLAGTQANNFESNGVIAECLDGRMIWQTISTHDYKYQEMVNLWQNYIYNALRARYAFLYE